MHPLEGSFILPISDINNKVGYFEITSYIISCFCCGCCLTINASLFYPFFHRSDTPFFPVQSTGRNVLILLSGFKRNGTITPQKFAADFKSVQQGLKFLFEKKK